VKVDYNALAASYSTMSDEDFDVVKREDLTLPARVCYDQEKSRGHPGWHYKPPEANAQYAARRSRDGDALRRRDRDRRQ
jgi:hypothetical protein